MTYDQWKLESPEDERERIERRTGRSGRRLQWLEDHADEINDERWADQWDDDDRHPDF